MIQSGRMPLSRGSPVVGSDSYVEADVRRQQLVEVYESMVLSSN